MPYSFLATAAFGLEGIVSNELKRLGFSAKAEQGCARFSGELADGFRANLCLRTADRVLLLLDEKPVFTFEELFQFASSIPWEQYLDRVQPHPCFGKVRAQSAHERAGLSVHREKGHCGAAEKAASGRHAAGDRGRAFPSKSPYTGIRPG